MSVVAVVDADETTRRRFARFLRSADFEIVEAADGLDALRSAFEARPDVTLVNLKAGGIDGYELIRILRAACQIPVIAFAEEPSCDETVRALDVGAADVIDSRASSAELVARTRAAIRTHERHQAHSGREPRQIATGRLVIDRAAQVVTKDGRRLQLTRTEHRLLDALASRAGQVAHRSFLLSTVWGDDCLDDPHYLRVYIGYLRAKLEDDPAQPRYIVNEWGLGYRLQLLPIEDAAQQADGADAAGSVALATRRSPAPAARRPRAGSLSLAR